MKPTLVATDLDGTLVCADGAVSDYTVSVLRALDKAGVPVLFVTGRPLRWARDVFEHVGELGIAIVSNGALVWDVARDEPLAQKPMTARVMLHVAEVLRGINPGVHFATETLIGFSHEPEYQRVSNPSKHPTVRTAPLSELSSEPVLKLLAMGEGIEPEAFWLKAQHELQDIAQVSWSGFEKVPLLEISGIGVNKATTLEAVVAKLGYTAENVVAFGDMPNDLPMLTWAGTAYAMGDAHPTVLACATHVTKSCDEDGVALALAEIFDLSV